MNRNKTDVYAPNIDSNTLWAMTPERFNSWRKEHDYPRIIKYLINHLPYFPQWMDTQQVDEASMLEFGPAVFLRPDKKISLYQLDGHSHDIGHHGLQSNIPGGKVSGRRNVVPYFAWIKKYKHKIGEHTDAEFSTIQWRAGRAFLDQRLELLNIGDVRLTRQINLGGKDLEFLNIDNLVIDHCHNNSILKLWYSSAVNLTVIGDLPFLDAYRTTFSYSTATRARSLKLSDGTFQDWHLTECEVRLTATNTTLFLWQVIGHQFECTIEHTELKESHFREGAIMLAGDHKKAASFHGLIKRIYAHNGLFSIAGEHYYKEKRFEQKSLLRPHYHFSNEMRRDKSRWLRLKLYVKAFTRYISLSFQNLLWGFGEKPSRVFIWSMVIVMFSALLYVLHPDSSTVGKGLDSLYFSMVTFTTLGYGEITQQNQFLKMFAALEAFLGLTFMGLVIAGFSTKSKDYS